MILPFMKEIEFSRVISVFINYMIKWLLIYLKI
jgi:hypothetical protein